jgi:hypothetical protein
MQFQGFSGGREREFDRGVGLGLNLGRLVRRGTAVRTSRTTRLGAGAERFIDDGLDGARAPATLRAAAEAAVDLLGVTREVFRGADGAADIMVAENVTGANNHKGGQSVGDAKPSIFKIVTRCKRKNPVFK